MSVEEKLSAEEISRRITAGMGLVYDLFNEMNNFFRQVLEALDSSAIEMHPIKKRFILPKPKKRTMKTAADDYVKTDMGFMAEVGVGGADDEDVEEIDEDEETELDQKKISITPESQFLAVRANLYDTKKTHAGSFEPFVVAAILSSFKRSHRKEAVDKGKAQSKFQLKKGGQLLRGAVLLDPSLEKGKEISWMIPKYIISAKVSGILSRTLVDFDTEEKFTRFIEDLVSMVEAA